MPAIKVVTEYIPGETNKTATVGFERREESWFVKHEEKHDDYVPFANTDASPRTVKQLIRKEWDDTY